MSVYSFSRLILMAGICLHSQAIFGQLRDITPGRTGTNPLDTLPDGVMPLDTGVSFSYACLQDPELTFTETDSFGWEDVRHDPLGFGFMHLGNLGSAVRSLQLNSDSPIGFSTGWHQYRPYYLNPATFPFYHQQIPVGRAKHSQHSQEDTYLTLDFGRRFAQGVSLSIVYDRINQIGEFNHQQQKNTGLGIGVWHDAPAGRYDAFYLFLSNSAAAEENGGISDPTLIGEPRQPDLSIPTFLNDGISNHKHRSFLTRQIFHINPGDSLFGIDIWGQWSYETGIYRYTDEQASDAAEFYGDLFLKESRGIRQFTYTQTHEVTGGISFPWKAAHSTLDMSLRYRSIRLEQEPELRQIHELYLDAAGAFQWVKPLLLEGSISVGLGQAEGNYRFAAKGILNTKLAGRLMGEWSLVSRQPSLVESALFVNQLPVYRNDFRNPLTSELHFQWHIEKLDMEAGVRWFVFDQYIYFDSMAFPQQIGSTISQQQLYLFKGFDFRWVGLNAKVVWQPEIRDELALPETMVSVGLYGRIRMFDRKVTMIPGVDLIYYGHYSGIRYFPVNGVFHLTGGESIPDYFRIDVGLGMKIRFLKAFVRFEDIGGALQDRILYQAELHPHYRGYLRLGVEASFFN